MMKEAHEGNQVVVNSVKELYAKTGATFIEMQQKLTQLDGAT